jgi:hypothetical protein
MTALRELQYQLRQLRKLKKETPLKSDSRRLINHQIRGIKESINRYTKPSTEKQILITKLNHAYQQKNRPIIVNFQEYDECELQKHLTYVLSGKV